MPISIAVVRPLPTQTASQNFSQGAAITEGATFWYVDITATINAQLRLLTRIKITPQVVGRTQRYHIELLNFAGAGASTFTAGLVTTPFTEAEATSKTSIGTSDFVDIHALATLAGSIAGA